MDFLVFAVVDLAAQNFLLAGIITYLVSWVSVHPEGEHMWQSQVENKH